MSLQKFEQHEQAPLTREQMLQVKGGVNPKESIDLTGTQHSRTHDGAHTNDDYGDADH